MSETTTTVATPAAPKTTKKARKTKPSASKTKAEYGRVRSHDLPWNDKKVSVFKALKALRAVGVTNARSAADIAKKANLTERDVRHYVYHAASANLAGIATHEDFRGYVYYLTAKGAALNPKVH